MQVLTYNKHSSQLFLDEFKVMTGKRDMKYTLLKNEDKLTEEQLEKLIQIKNVSPILKEMHEFKEKIRKIFNTTQDWYTLVIES